MNHYHSFTPILFSGVSAAKFNGLIEQLGHLGLTVNPTAQGYSASGNEIAVNFSHDADRNTLMVEIQQVPGVATPGYFVGRLYDEILCISE